MRVCILCKELRYSSGDRGYSEYTPGFDAQIECKKGHWRWEEYEDDAENFRRKMLSATDCPDYEFYDDGVQEPDLTELA